MKFCPFAQRTRLVLCLKNLPHDIVNINLRDKPEWLFKLHPEGKVPALDNGSKLVIESLDISDYLDENYPNPPLYPSDPAAKQKQKELIQGFGAILPLFYQACEEIGDKTVAERTSEFLPHLEKLESFLKEQGTTYFGGSSPGMADYMFWPWAERYGVFKLIYKQDVPITEGQFPLLCAWKKAMRNDPVVDALYIGHEKFHKMVQMYKSGEKGDYDAL